jgi:hypothetical protein
MRHSAEFFKKKVFLRTPRYATQCEIHVKNFLADSALCGTAQSHRYLQRKFCNFATICENNLTLESVTQVSLIDEKTRGPKISFDYPFKTLDPNGRYFGFAFAIFLIKKFNKIVKLVQKKSIRIALHPKNPTGTVTEHGIHSTGTVCEHKKASL